MTAYFWKENLPLVIGLAVSSDRLRHVAYKKAGKNFNTDLELKSRKPNLKCRHKTGVFKIVYLLR